MHINIFILLFSQFIRLFIMGGWSIVYVEGGHVNIVYLFLVFLFLEMVLSLAP